MFALNFNLCPYLKLNYDQPLSKSASNGFKSSPYILVMTNYFKIVAAVAPSSSQAWN